MSLINDALKRAHESQDKGPAPTAPPPMAPVVVEPPSGGFGWFLPVAVVLVLIAAVLFVWLAVAHKSSKHAATHAVAAAAPAAPSVTPAPPNHPAPATSAPATVPPVASPKSAEAQPAPAVNSSTTTGLLTAHLPKVQGIIFSQPPTAIVNGKVVNVGDHVGYYLVKQITRNKVILQGQDGSEQQLAVGQ